MRSFERAGRGECRRKLNELSIAQSQTCETLCSSETRDRGTVRLELREQKRELLGGRLARCARRERGHAQLRRLRRIARHARELRPKSRYAPDSDRLDRLSDDG